MYECRGFLSGWGIQWDPHGGAEDVHVFSWSDTCLCICIPACQVCVKYGTSVHILQRTPPPHHAHPVQESGKMHASYLLQPAKMFVEIDIILHSVGPSLCRALWTLGNNLATATKIPEIHSRTKIALFTCAFYLSVFAHFYSASILQPAEGTARTSVHVVCCLGSLKLLEPSRISQPVPVGCSPFHSSLPFFFLPLSSSLFSFFSCLSPQTASVLSGSSWPLISLRPTLLAAELLYLQPALCLCLKYLWGDFFFLCGASKRGTEGEKTFYSTCLSDVRRKESV